MVLNFNQLIKVISNDLNLVMITLNICPSVRYCSHALRSGGCSSNDRRAKYVASSKYCKTISTLAKFNKTSAL